MTIKQLIGKRAHFGGMGTFTPSYEFKTHNRPVTRISPPRYRCMVQHRDGRLVLVEHQDRAEYERHKASVEARHKIRITVTYM